MPGFGVPAGLPGLPSPAQGVPATPDLLSGLAQAAPQFIQGEQAGQEMKEKREQDAIRQLQQIAPFAVAQPSNPATIKSIQKQFKALGMDPKAALNPDGTLNTAALIQYNPYFPIFQSALQRPDIQQGTIDFLGQQIGLKPDQIPKVGMGPKQVNELYQNYQKQMTNYQTQGGDKTSLMQSADAYAQALRVEGNGPYADAILREANAAQPSDVAKSKVTGAEALANYRNKEADWVSSQLGLQGLKGKEIESRIEKNIASIATEQENANAHMMSAEAAMSNANAHWASVDVQRGRLNLDTNKSILQTAKDWAGEAKDFNTNYQSLIRERTAMQGTIQRYEASFGANPPDKGTLMQMPDPNGRTGPDGQPIMVPTTYAGAKQTLERLNQQIGAMQQTAKNSGFAIPSTGLIDPLKIYNRVLQGQGMPLGTKAVGEPTTTKPAPSSNTQYGYDLSGQSFTTRQVKDFAAQAGMSYQEAIKALRKRHAKIKP